jgi:large subunit ribosomal protein L19e
MNMSIQKKLVARMKKVGKNRIWLDPDKADKIANAVSREDLRKLLEDKFIVIAEKMGISRSRAKIRLKKKAGKSTGPGKRKGTKKARSPPKKQWMIKIRAQRSLLKKLRNEGKITKRIYRKYYLQAKGNMFRSKKHLIMVLAEKNEFSKGEKNVF